MTMHVVDVELGGSITRLQARHTYLLVVPDDCSPDWVRDVRERLDEALAAMGPERAAVFIVSDSVRLEDITAQIAGGRAS